DINTSIQRCLVKAIALHGLGLYIYAGEDLPMVEGEGSQPQEESRMNTLIAKWKVLGGTEDQFNEWYQGQIEKGYNEIQMEQYLTKKLLAKKGACYEKDNTRTLRTDHEDIRGINQVSKTVQGVKMTLCY